MKPIAIVSSSLIVLMLLSAGLNSIYVNRAETSQEESLILKGHQGGVSDVRNSPDGSVIASSGLDGTVRLWDATSGKELKIIRGHDSEVFAVAFSGDGTRLASSGYDGSVRVWDVKSGSLVHLYRFDSYSTAIDISPNGMLAVGSQDGMLHILNLANNEPVREFSIDWPVYSLAFSGDGAILATGGPIRLWDTTTWKQITQPSAPGGVFDLEFAPKQSILASAHLRGVTYIWSGKTFEQAHAYKATISFRGLGPKGSVPMEISMPVVAVAFSPDGKNIASAGADKVVRLWSVTSGSLIKEFKGHTMSVVGLSFNSNGDSLASASLDGTVRIWKLR